MQRAYESLLNEYLRAFPCVAIVGVRQCGKTTMLQTLPSKWKRYDLERQADQQLVARDPDAFFRLNPRHVAIDEVQVIPAVLPALRVAIDEHRSEKGRFVITGSSSPSLLRAVSESLAGRIGLIEMAPFSWAEVTETLARDCFIRRVVDRKAAPKTIIEGLDPRGDIRLAHEFWFNGGYPEPWIERSNQFRSRWIDQYFKTYLFRDVQRLFPGMDEIRYRRFVELLAGLAGRVINYSEVARALGVSQPTARDYFEIAHGTFVWRRIPAYTGNTLKRLVKHPKGYMRDSGLLHALLRIPDLDALLSHPQMGASWEGMVIEEILRQLNAMGVPYDASYYRTSGGAEVDLVIEGDFGRVAFEIKHTSTVPTHDLRALADFVAEQRARLGVVINNDTQPRLYTPKIIGLPFTWL
ncbi:MAG: ATP-binding protein [Verrucomicrobiota bacterium]|nr:ATP-binding protein [Verrucomicrobiota bacterium]